MGQVKPWQIVLVIVAIAAAATSAYITLSGGSEVQTDDHVLLVDITNGDLYSFPTGGHKAIVTPGKNPDTGKIAMFRVYKNDAGNWTVSSRDLGALPMVEGEPEALLDRKSGHVTVNNETPKQWK